MDHFDEFYLQIISTEKPKRKRSVANGNDIEKIYDEINLPNLILEHKNYFMLQGDLDVNLQSEITQHKYQIKFTCLMGKVSKTLIIVYQ